MASGLAEAIRIFEEEKGISHELALKTIEDTMLAAYKKKFGTVEGVEVKFSDDENEVYLQVKKKIVDDVIDDAVEIDIDEAKEKFGMTDCEIGDELLIDIDPHTFKRMEVQSAQQRINQRGRAIKDDKIYSEFIDKVGEMIVGYCQREHNGNIFVDLGKTEGILPKRYQSPREVYHANDRIKAYVYEVKKDENGLSIVLSRTHTEFVKKLFELEVPEIADKTIEIFKIVREPGYRVKMSVYTHRDDIDPVGACVGLRGARIQAVVRETDEYTLNVARGQGGAEAQGSVSYVSKEDLKFVGQDVRFHSTPAKLKSDSSQFFGSLLFWLCLALPLFILILLVIISRKRVADNANMAKVRAGKANSVATKRLKVARKLMKDNRKDEFYDEMMRALLGYFGDKLSIPVADLSKENIETSLKRRNVPEEPVKQVIGLLDDCEFARYAPGDDTGRMDRLYDEAARVIGQIENTIK